MAGTTGGGRRRGAPRSTHLPAPARAVGPERTRLPQQEAPPALRQEMAHLRAEVQRLAAEVDKLWARERGRTAAVRTARSIAGKPVRTGTRASRPAAREERPAAAGGSATARPRAPRGRPQSGTVRGRPGDRSGWAKPKPASRRSPGGPPKRRGR